MKGLSEKEFTLKRIVPLLNRLGYQGVRYTGGIDEFGRDIVFYDTDRFGFPRLYGAQVKIGDVSGSASGDIDKIISQMDDAFQMPFYDPSLGEEKYIIGFYIIISGKYKRNAKEKIRIKCKRNSVFFLDGNDIENIEYRKKEIVSDNLNYELNRLKREALASIRSKETNLSPFELKLHEIDLLENLSIEKKIEVLNDIGMEVSLNSDVGTNLLIEQLLWQVAGWDSKSIIKDIAGLEGGMRLLNMLAVTLWNWGLQAVEYRRGIDTIKNALDAIQHIARISKLINSVKSYNYCKDALKAMYNMAVSENRKEVAELIDVFRKKII